MNCVILQPSYIPWRGYFHQIHKADVFVFYDDVPYDKHGWRNRNRVKTPQGTGWLTIPVHSKGNVVQQTPINQIRVSWGDDWNARHWMTIRQFYSKAPFFRQYAPLLEEFYGRRPEFLADFTIDLTIALAKELGIGHTSFVRSSILKAVGRKTDRLLSILQSIGATHYISGPAAKDYIEEDKLSSAGISLEYMAYEYPEYEQLYPPFDPYVSILDLLFMAGPRAPRYIWEPNALP
jgi:hypothetical protein